MKKNKDINKVEILEERIAQTDSEKLKEKLKAKQQAVLKKLFDGVERADAEFTKIEGDASTQSGGTITVDGIYTGCNGSPANWNFAAQTYSSSTWWNVSHWFPNAISVGTSPNCTGADWDYNLYVESVEIIGEKGCHANLSVAAMPSYWPICDQKQFKILLNSIRQTRSITLH